MHRVWAARRAWWVRLGIALGLVLLLLPLAVLVHPAWALVSALGLLYPTRWEEPRALADLDRRYGLAYRSALEAPAHHPWRDQLRAEAEASLRGARPPAFPWIAAGLYLALVGLVWFLPPLGLPSAASSAAPAPSEPASTQEEGATGPQAGQPPSVQAPPQSPGTAAPGSLEPPSGEAEGSAGGTTGQEAPQEAADGTTQPDQPGQGLQPPASSQENRSAAQPGNPEGQPQPTASGQPQTGQPAQDVPGQAQPPPSGQPQPPQTGRSSPGQTPQGQPVLAPSGAEPNPSGPPPQPPQAEPSQPGPGRPEQAQPQPGRASPADGQRVQGRGQPGGGEQGNPGVGTQARPAQRPPANPQRPAGEAPLSRGEGQQGRPMPLPSPWRAGQPPENVQRQAEKYLESEPLPPEVREVVRRYFELPQR